MVVVSSTVAAITATAGAISAGASVASTAAGFGAMDFSVKFKLEIENYTNEYLSVYQHKCHTGLIKEPASGVNPAKKESLSGHKTGDTATGRLYRPVFCSSVSRSGARSLREFQVS